MSSRRGSRRALPFWTFVLAVSLFGGCRTRLPPTEFVRCPRSLFSDASCHTVEHDEAAYLTCGADSDCPSGNVCYCDAATCSLGPLYPIVGGPYSNVCGPAGRFLPKAPEAASPRPV